MKVTVEINQFYRAALSGKNLRDVSVTEAGQWHDDEGAAIEDAAGIVLSKSPETNIVIQRAVFRQDTVDKLNEKLAKLVLANQQ